MSHVTEGGVAGKHKCTPAPAACRLCLGECNREKGGLLIPWLEHRTGQGRQLNPAGRTVWAGSAVGNELLIDAYPPSIPATTEVQNIS